MIAVDQNVRIAKTKRQIERSPCGGRLMLTVEEIDCLIPRLSDGELSKVEIMLRKVAVARECAKACPPADSPMGWIYYASWWWHWSRLSWLLARLRRTHAQ